MEMIFICFSLFVMNICIIMHVTALSLKMKRRRCHFCYTDSVLSVIIYALIACLAVITEIRCLYTKEIKDCILPLLLLFQYFLIFSKSYVLVGDDCIYVDGHLFSVNEQIEGQTVTKSIWFGRKLYVINAKKTYAGVYVTSKGLKRIWRNETIIEEDASLKSTGR